MCITLFYGDSATFLTFFQGNIGWFLTFFQDLPLRRYNLILNKA